MLCCIYVYIALISEEKTMCKFGVTDNFSAAETGIPLELEDEESEQEIMIISEDNVERVPTLDEVEAAITSVSALLETDREEAHLPYNDLRVLNFFILGARLNVPANTLMRLTWTDLNVIAQEGFMLMNCQPNHEVFIRVSRDQFLWLEHMNAQFQHENGVEPEMLFCSTYNAAFTYNVDIMAEETREIFRKYNLGGDKDFHPSALQRMWVNQMASQE